MREPATHSDHAQTTASHGHLGTAAVPAPPTVLRDALRAYAGALGARFGDRVRFVRLFGSWPRGEAREDSDVDVAAVIDGLTRDEWRDAAGDAVEVELAMDVTLSPFVVSGEHFDLLVRRERRIALDILEQGIAV